MKDAFDHLGAILIDGTLATAALLGLTALAMIGTRQPARRCVLARAAILGALLVVPLGSLGVFPRLAVRVPGEVWAPIKASVAPLHPHLPGLRWWTRCVTLAVFGGLGVGIIGGILAATASLRLLSRTVEAAPETLAIYESLPCRTLRRPLLRVAARVRGPLLVGTIRQTIVIPTELDQPGQEAALRLSLLHEISHAERHDPWFAVLGALAGSAWFFLPPLWWVRHQMRLDCEFLADRTASEEYGPPPAYASSLVGLAGGGSPPGAGGAMAAKGATDGSALFQRVLMLVRCPFPVELWAPRWWRLSVVLAVGTGTVVASGLSVRGGAEAGPASCPTPEHGSIVIERLAIEGDQKPVNGRSRPYTLLQQLPPAFELTMEVLAPTEELAEISVAGKHLAPTRPEQWPDPLRSRTGPHPVRLWRTPSGLHLEVAGIAIPGSPSDLPCPPFLAFEAPPNRVIRFRNIRIRW